MDGPPGRNPCTYAFVRIPHPACTHFLSAPGFLAKTDTLHTDIYGLRQDRIYLLAIDAERHTCYRCEDQNNCYPNRSCMLHFFTFPFLIGSVCLNTEVTGNFNTDHRQSHILSRNALSKFRSKKHLGKCPQFFHARARLKSNSRTSDMGCANQIPFMPTVYPSKSMRTE